MLAYRYRVAEKNDDSKTMLYTSFVGDVCDGTAYSDRTDPKCVKIYEFLQYFNLNSLILGNHDIAYDDTL